LEHRASLVVGLVGFGFVAFVLISLASRINTHPDIDHFVPPPTPTRSAARSRATAADLREARRVADGEQSTKELLVDAAASRYTDRAREQLRRFHTGLPADIPCERLAKRPTRGSAVYPASPPGPGVEIWQASIRCLTPSIGFDVVFPVSLVREGDRWEIESETRAAFEPTGRYLNVAIRQLSSDEFKLAQAPALRR